MHLVILSVSAGAGHLRAAEAVRAAATAAGHRATHLDLMELAPRLFRSLYCGSYRSLVDRHPAIWGYLYHRTDRTHRDAPISRLRREVERLCTRALRQRLLQLAPDAIVCTHFLPAQVCAGLGLRIPVWVVVTDFDVHALWAHPGLTGYCVADEEIAWRIRERGIGTARVAVTGIPVMPAFARRPDRLGSAAALGLDPHRTTLLLMGGGAGVGGIDRVAERLLGLPTAPQLVALAGRNRPVLRQLQRLAERAPGRLLALGFTERPELAMACADLVVTKPGGLTTAECLALGLPMLTVSPIPGQEERNADFLLEHGAALKAHDPAGLDYRARTLLGDPGRLAAMAAAAARLGRPDAAARVAALALGA